MKTITMFEAEDGQKFQSAAECLEYEAQCADLAAANDMLKNGSTLMAAIIRSSPAATWWDRALTLEDKVILMKTTRETRFVVSGCPFRAHSLMNGFNGRVDVMLFGKNEETNSGYGNWVTLSELLCYARETELEYV